MKSELKGVSDAELVEELERRKREAAEVLTRAPTPLPNPDFTALRAMVIDGVDYFAEQGIKSKDFEHYVYEAALTAIYGHDYWKWHNARIR